MFREKQKIAPREGRQTGCLRAKTVRGVYPNQQAERLPLPLVDNHIIPRNACRVSRGCAGLEYRERLDVNSVHCAVSIYWNTHETPARGVAR